MASLNWGNAKSVRNPESYSPGNNKQNLYDRNFIKRNSSEVRKIYVPSSDEIKSLEDRLKTKDAYASIYVKTEGGFHYSIRFNRKVFIVRSFPDLLVFVGSKVSS